MTFAAPPTFTDGAVLTGASLNILRDDINETAPAKASAAGQLFVSTGANAIAARTVSGNNASGTDTTSGTSYTDLAGGAGPLLSVTTGVAAIVVLSTRVSNSTAAALSYMGYAITGATTLAADSGRSFNVTSPSSNQNWAGSHVTFETGLTSGSNTFTCKYQVSSGTGSWSNRRLLVIPL